MAGSLAPSAALSDALVILGAAGIVIPAFARFRITPIIGFILVGLAVGPYGLGSLVGQTPWLYHITISDPEAIAPFAEFGIILLLFEIGLELSFNRLWSMRRLVFGLGAMELAGGALLIGLALMSIMGESLYAALGLGLALALSSTALVLPISGTQGRSGARRCRCCCSRTSRSFRSSSCSARSPPRRRPMAARCCSIRCGAAARHRGPAAGRALPAAKPVRAGRADQKPRTVPRRQPARRHRRGARHGAVGLSPIMGRCSPAC
jgi:hypothetical protein